MPDLDVVRTIISKFVCENLQSRGSNCECGVAVAWLLIPQHDPSCIAIGIESKFARTLRTPPRAHARGLQAASSGRGSTIP